MCKGCIDCSGTGDVGDGTARTDRTCGRQRARIVGDQGQVCARCYKSLYHTQPDAAVSPGDGYLLSGAPSIHLWLHISATTFSSLLRDIIAELYRHGARQLVIVNGHYENFWPAIEGIELSLDSIGRGQGTGPKILCSGAC